MNLVEVFGAADALRAVDDMEGTYFVPGTMKQVEGDRWVLGGYVVDDALAKIQASGLEVNVVESASDREERLAQMKIDSEGEAIA